MEHRVLKVLDDPQNSFTEMHVTLLAAGFVIGPSGQSVRAICEKSGAHIQSSTRSGVQGPHRLFAIVGNDKCRASAQHIIESAVNLYQQLFRGLGKCVSRQQLICGVQFTWQPPPKSAVPQATPLELPSSPGMTYEDIRAWSVSKMDAAAEHCYLNSSVGSNCGTSLGGYSSGYPFWCVYSPYTTVLNQTLSSQELYPRQTQWVGPVYGHIQPGVNHVAGLNPSWAPQNAVQPNAFNQMFWCNPLPQGMPEHRWTPSTTSHAVDRVVPCSHSVLHEGGANQAAVLPSTPCFDACGTSSGTQADYNAQMSACARSSYCVLFDTPSSQ